VKIHIEIDVTPEELRRLHGLPDFTEIHTRMTDQLREAMNRGEAGALGKMLSPMVAGGLSSIESYNKLLMTLLSMGRKSDGKTSDDKEEAG
jgi:hypothetical protein